MVKKKFILPLITLLLIVIADRISKISIMTNEIGTSIPIIEGFFHITYVVNTGAGFGMLKNMNIFLLIFSLIVFFFVSYYFFKEKNKWNRMSLIILASGIIGNVIDRIQYGAVIDFLDFRVWPVFNIADIAICTGIIWLIISMLIEDRKSKMRMRN